MSVTHAASMDGTIDSGGVRLVAHLARPAGHARVPGLVLCHGFPSGPRGAAASATSFPELAERLADEAGWAVWPSTAGDRNSMGLLGRRVARDQRAGRPVGVRAHVIGVWIAARTTADPGLCTARPTTGAHRGWHASRGHLQEWTATDALPGALPRRSVFSSPDFPDDAAG